MRDLVPASSVSVRTAEEAAEHGALHPADLARIAVMALAATVVWFRLWEPLPQISLIGLAATLVGGYPILREAVENLVERKMTMELSMTIAIAAALAIGEAFTALVITLFVLVAEILEGLTVSRGRRAIEDLLNYLPRTARVRRRDELIDLPLDQLRAGDVVLVSPGGRLPVDGAVAAGHSFVDEATITGESMPVEKAVGSGVFAGTINQSGALEIRADRLGRDTSFGKIIEAVERAERSRAPVQKTADRLSGYLVYFALGAALFTFALTRDARSTISVVIVAGACGIAAGTPLAILGAIGRAARQGSIVKGGLHLETLANVDTIVFDKTGTVTLGKPEVTEVRPAPGWAARDVLQAALTVENRSEHPLGAAIVRRAAADSLVTPDSVRFESTPGRGVACLVGQDVVLAGSRAFLEERDVLFEDPKAVEAGASEVLVARGGTYVGSILIADAVRPEARRAISALQKMGLETILLTGDAAPEAERVASSLGIDSVEAGLLPDQKQARVKGLVAGGRVVAMVGDGVNDAPALAEANVGIAMGSGTDVARESADIVLLGNDLLKLVETVRIARRAQAVILQNFTGTLVVDGVGILMASMGLLNPLLAAFIHVASELAFILNSTRLLPATSAGRSSTSSLRSILGEPGPAGVTST
jgi:heavy metal translocating P-type ATPase